MICITALTATQICTRACSKMKSREIIHPAPRKLFASSHLSTPACSTKVVTILCAFAVSALTSKLLFVWFTLKSESKVALTALRSTSLECDFVTGNRTAEVCAHLTRLLPSKSRARMAKDSNINRRNQLSLDSGVTFPICFAADPEESFSNARIFFASSSQKELFYGPTKGQAVSSLSPLSASSVSISLWFFQGVELPAELEVTETDLESNLSTIAPLARSRFDKETQAEQLWSAGHLLNSSQGYFLAAHQGYYHIAIFKHVNGTFVKLKTSGFEDVGGENIGSLFEHGGNIYLSARLNLRYHLRSFGGHGWRYPGIYRLDFKSKGIELSEVHGTLVSQTTDDADCCDMCGGSVEAKHFAHSCEVLSDSWWGCLDQPDDASAFAWSLTGDDQCVERSSRAKFGECEFPKYYKCVHICRNESEKYHSSVVSHGGLLLGLMSERKGDTVLLCHLHESTFEYRCFRDPISHLQRVMPTHPMMSGIVGTDKYLIMTECVTEDSKDVELDSGTAKAIVHFWKRDNFCSIGQSIVSSPGYAIVRLKVESSFAILYSAGADQCHHAKVTLGVKILGSYGPRDLPQVSSLTHQMDEGQDANTCWMYFDPDDDCGSGCKLEIKFSNVHITGLVAVVKQ